MENETKSERAIRLLIDITVMSFIVLVLVPILISCLFQ